MNQSGLESSIGSPKKSVCERGGCDGGARSADAICGGLWVGFGELGLFIVGLNCKDFDLICRGKEEVE